MADLPRTEWVTPRKAAELAGVTPQTIVKWVRRRQLGALHAGRYVRGVWLDDLEFVIEKRREEEAKARLLRFAAEGSAHNHGKINNTMKAGGFCYRCGCESEPGRLCEFCATETRGMPYWARRGDGADRGDCMAGLLTEVG